MEQWYRAGGWGDKQITPVDVVRETKKQVIILEIPFTFSNRKMIPLEKHHLKQSSYENYFKTYQEAYEFILSKKTQTIHNLSIRLESEKTNLNSFVKNYNPKP